jgi:hypothetical protein
LVGSVLTLAAWVFLLAGARFFAGALFLLAAGFLADPVAAGFLVEVAGFFLVSVGFLAVELEALFFLVVVDEVVLVVARGFLVVDAAGLLSLALVHT